MPLYEYICTDCGHQFDMLQSFSAEPIRVCPKCTKETIQKKISNSGFILKGGGWYKDHYGLKKSDSTSSADSKSADSNKGSSGDSSKE